MDGESGKLSRNKTSISRTEHGPRGFHPTKIGVACECVFGAVCLPSEKSSPENLCFAESTRVCLICVPSHLSVH